MRDFYLVFKTLYRNATPKNEEEQSGKKKLSNSLKLVLSISPLIIMVCAMMAFLCINLKSLEELSLVLIAMVGAVQMVVLFLSLYSIITTLYEAKDMPFLSSLPLSPKSIFFAKFAMTYVSALKLSTFILTPLSSTAIIAFNIATKSMFYGIYPLVLLILIVSPLLPLFIVTLFSMPVVWIGTYMKSKPILKSILTIAFYVVLMCAYLVLVYFMNTSGLGQEGDVELSQGALSSLTTLSYVLYPNRVLVCFCLGIDMAKNFGISAAICIGMLALMLGLSALFYRRISMRKVEGIKAGEAKSTTLKQSNVTMSLVKRDFYSIMRSGSLSMSSFANLIMAPLFIVLMYFITNSEENVVDMVENPLLYEMLSIGYVIMYSMIFLGGANMLANIAYTREGKSFFATKCLPIKPKDSIRAKLLLSVLCSLVVMVPIMLIAILLYKIDIISTLFVALDTMLMVTGVCAMSILFDMKKGNQHWETTQDLNASTKGNTYQLISVFCAVIPAVVIFVVGIILSVFTNTLGEVLVKVIYFSIATIFSVVVAIVGLSILNAYGQKWYEHIGENKPKIKTRTKPNTFGGARLMK